MHTVECMLSTTYVPYESYNKMYNAYHVVNNYHEKRHVAHGKSSPFKPDVFHL